MKEKPNFDSENGNPYFPHHHTSNNLYNTTLSLTSARQNATRRKLFNCVENTISDYHTPHVSCLERNIDCAEGLLLFFGSTNTLGYPCIEEVTL